MSYVQTSTPLGTISTATAGQWVQIPRAGAAGPIVQLEASDVTDGATVRIEGRRRTGIAHMDVPTTPTKVVHTIAVTEDGTHVIPLRELTGGGTLPDEVRINVPARTDGTYIGTLLTGG